MRAALRLVSRREYPPPTWQWALVHFFCAASFCAAAVCWLYVAIAPQTVTISEPAKPPNTLITSGTDR